VLTNNSTKTRDQIASKMRDLEFSRVTPQCIVSSGIVTAAYLAKKQFVDPVYLVGSEGLRKTFDAVGVKHFGMGPDLVEHYTNGTIPMDVDVSQRVSAVVCSFDPYFGYMKVMRAANYLNSGGVEFICTNEDATFPGDRDGVVIPGSGIVSAAIKCATGREPTVMGKPSQAMFDYIAEHYDVDPRKTVMIGDRCDTDIAFGKMHGLDTILVLSGIHSLDNVSEAVKAGRLDQVPDAYADSLKDFVVGLQNGDTDDGRI